jgi:predicted ester cyclase
MPGTDNATIVRQFTEKAWNQGDLAICDELLAPAFVSHNSGAPDQRGIPEAKQFIGALRAAFPDVHYTIEELITQNESCAARLLMTGTQSGPLEFMPGVPSIPPSGKHVTLPVSILVHFAGGKVAEQWSFVDRMGLLEQLGVAPLPHTTAATTATPTPRWA